MLAQFQHITFLKFNQISFLINNDSFGASNISSVEKEVLQLFLNNL